METFYALLAICAGNSPVPVNSPNKGQWRETLMFSLICVWINGWVNNLKAGDLRRYHAHYDVIVMLWIAFTRSVANIAANEMDIIRVGYHFPHARVIIAKSIVTSSQALHNQLWRHQQHTTRPSEVQYQWVKIYTKINTKITLSWTHKEFTTPTHTSSSIYLHGIFLNHGIYWTCSVSTDLINASEFSKIMIVTMCSRVLLPIYQ